MPSLVLNRTRLLMKPSAPSAHLENTAQQQDVLPAAVLAMFHVLQVNTLYLVLHLLKHHSQLCVQVAQQVPFLHPTQLFVHHVQQGNLALSLEKFPLFALVLLLALLVRTPVLELFLHYHLLSCRPHLSIIRSSLLTSMFPPSTFPSPTPLPSSI